MLAFRVLFQDESILVVDKPSGFHTHPPEDPSLRISPRWNGLGILERQVQQTLFPVHRLDRACSGVLVLSKKRELNRALQEQFADRSVEKTYACLARGEIREELRIDRPLPQKSGTDQPALTRIVPVHSFPLRLGETDRLFTFLWAFPETGRFHQIRRHLAGASHPLLGDSQHGDRKLNRSVKENCGLERMFLRCMEMRFRHPVHGREMAVRTRWSRDWHKAFERAGICPLLTP